METDLTVRLHAIPGATPVSWEHGQIWMRAPDLDVQAMAQALLGLGARLSTMTGIALDPSFGAAEAGGETAILYHYALNNAAITIEVCTRRNTLASITPIVRAADWCEREIHDLYSVEFLGRPNLAPLVRPPDVPQGYFREPGGAAGKALRDRQPVER
jgi:NADH:ubiquinone oxidoreductase subunit C